MRSFRRILAIVLALILCVSVCTVFAHAATASQDGLELTLTTDKTSYNRDEPIAATLTVKNAGDRVVTDLTLDHTIPEGYTVKDGNTSCLEVNELAPGEAATLQVSFVPGESTETPPDTADIASPGLSFLLMILSAAGLIALAIQGKQWKQMLSLVLCAAMLLSLFAAVPVQAKAAEAERQTIEITDVISVAGAEFQMKASVSYQIISAEDDADADGVADYLEGLFGSSAECADTDGDGLSDYIEIFKISTNPAATDTDGNGIADSEEDADGDTLANVQEIELGLDPSKVDTDSDGLTDSDELHKYDTDPLRYDTDADGASDGFEIGYKSSPLTADQHFEINQTTQCANTGVAVSIHATLSGEQVDTLSLELVEDDIVFPRTMPGYIGNACSVMVDGDLNSAVISFTIDPLLLHGEPTIFRYNENTCVMEALETTIDGNTVSAAAETSATYILLDKAAYYRSFGRGSEIAEVMDFRLDTDGDMIPDFYEDHMITPDGEQLHLDKYSADTNSNGIRDDAEIIWNVVYSEDGQQTSIVGTLATTTAADSDYDGKPNTTDKAPSNNKFTGKLISNFATSSVSGNMDYRWFFGNNTTYNAKLSKVSLLLSAVIYEGTSLNLSDSVNKQKTNGTSAAEVMNYFGMSNVKTYHLGDYYSDDHLSEFAIGYHDVTYNGKTKTVLAIVVRGTNGTLQEWASNFDVGELSTNTSTDDWTNTKNHKGFDITANRITKLVNKYITENGLSKSSLVYWVTGHSRGAAIANIMGANLEKAGKTAFTYTFAAPNTTLATDAKSYKTIFNIINNDDFVPCLPMAAWGYTRYGRSTSSVSIKDSYEKTWEKTTGIFDYNSDTFNMQGSVDAIAKVIPQGSDARVSLYTFTCNCAYSKHRGDASNDTITVTHKLSSTSKRTKEIAKIPSNATPYCYIRQYKVSGLNPYAYDVCQKPAYFMQLLAAMMGGEINAYRFAIELNIADRYEGAKTAIVAAYLSGIEHPHYPESYYVIANNITGTAFN